MDLNKRIQNIEKYFKLFNMTNEGSYVAVEFDKHWVVPENIPDSPVSVYYKDDKNLYYFYVGADGDIDSVFDCIDRIVADNLEIMEKAELFREKINELKNLFDGNEIKRLRNLEFVFVENKDDEVTNEGSTVDEIAGSAQYKPEGKKRKRNKSKNSESLLDLAENIVDGNV